MFLLHFSPPEHRGLIGGLSGYMIGIGGFLGTHSSAQTLFSFSNTADTANWIGFACAHASNGAFQWRFPLALQIPPGVILLIGLIFFLPESPRWLIRNGRDEEAKAAFTKIRGDLDGVSILLGSCVGLEVLILNGRYSHRVTRNLPRCAIRLCMRR